MLVEKQYYGSYSSVSPYIDLSFPHSFHQIILELTRTTEHNKTLIDLILMNSPEKVIQGGVTEMGLSDHELFYCSRKLYWVSSTPGSRPSIPTLRHSTLQIKT